MSKVQLFRSITSLTIIAAVFYFTSSQVLALSAAQKKAFQGGVLYANTEEQALCFGGASAVASPINSGPVDPTIYVLGDSLTVGMRDAGNMQSNLSAKGWTATKINAIGGKNLNWGYEQVQADKSIIATSGAVLIGLGTNNVGDVVNNSGGVVEGGSERIKGMMRNILSEVKLARQGVRIYWTNTYGTGTLTTEYGSFSLDTAMGLINTAIQEVAAEQGVIVIPWSTSSQAAQFVPADDVHPNGHYPEMADFVIGQLGTPQSVSSGTGTGAAASCSCSAGGPTQLIGDDNMQKVFNYFVAKGYTPAQSAGIVGNMINESGVQPMRLQGTSNGTETPSSTITSRLNEGIGWGIVQWTPPNKIIGTSAAAGIPYETIDTLDYQVDFLWKQLEGTAISSNEKAAGDKLKTATTVEDAAVFFAGYYERFANSGTIQNGQRVLNLSNPEYQKRIDSAKDVLSIYGGGGSSPSLLPGGSSSGCGGGGSGAISTAGYSFPLEFPENRTIGGISLGQTVTTHHDGTPAFDLSYANVTGKSVYAIYDGVIDRVGTQDPGWCNSVQLKAADGFYYWYGHLTNVRVTDKQTVKAGDLIGEIATWTPDHTCNGTSSGAHLHIDRGCTIDGVPQRGGSDSCRDPEFIPFLSKLYEELK